MGASKRPCVFEVFGVGWGGVITFMSLACKVMRRGCYVDVTLIILWCYVEEPLRLLLIIVWGSGGVGWVWGGFVLGIEVSYQLVVSDIQVFCSTSCQKLMMDLKLYICYAADGDNIEYFVQHHVRNWWWVSSYIYATLRRNAAKFVTVSHNKSQFTKKIRKTNGVRLAGTQQIDRVWYHVNKSIPKTLNNRKAGYLNETDIMKCVWVFLWRRNCHNDMYKCLGDLCRKSGWNKEKKKRTAAFSNMMAFVPQKPVKSHRDSHFSIPFHDFWHTHNI